MKLIVGLGNPGMKYERTRHNAGFMVLDRLAQRHAPSQVAKSRFHALTLDVRIGSEPCVLLKPMTYMNRSGQSVAQAVHFFKLAPEHDLIVIVDDVALPVGTIRLRPGGSDGGHNGLADIDRALAGAPYPRVRVGIGAVPQFMVRADWVLSRFMKEELESVQQAVDSAADAVEMVVTQGLDAAMNRFNRKVSPPQDE
ncbi:MAG: aminoacyl-tRNA hydrolase [Planctomycetota bacterium]|nr:MAG: aminoacyl-tRNA hydrolase [Planctomycetota bacterium]